MNNKYMRIFPLSSTHLSSDVLRFLKGGAVRSEQDQLIDYRTPFYAIKANEKANYSARSRISGVQGYRPTSREEIVNKCFELIKTTISDYPDYLAGEEKFKAYAISPRSIKLGFSKIMDSAIEPYYSNANQDFDPEVKMALENALTDGEATLRTKIPKGSLRYGDLDTAVDKLPATTNGGAPYFKTGKQIYKDESGKQAFEDNRPLYKKIAEDLINTGKIDRNANAFGSIGRGQETNDDKKRVDGIVISKQRRPGAEGHAGTIIGALIYPYYHARAKFPVRAALVNQLEVDRIIASNGTAKYDGVVSWDGSAYDTHMIPWLGKRIGQIILDCFHDDKKKRTALTQYFDHVFGDPLITPLGLIVGQHGMPSGTTITNELDSNYNEVLALAIKHLTNGKIELNMIAAQGDDAVMNMVIHDPAMKKELDTEDKVKEGLSKTYSRLLMDVNPKKNTVSKTKCEFLKRLHLKGTLESYRSYCGTVIGMCNMERAKDGKGPMYTARGIMQAANHYETLPGFNEFMQFIVKGDSMYEMGLKIKGGPKAIFQMAGGDETVIKRLGYSGYTTHLGVTVSDNSVKLNSTLSSVRGLEKHQR